jgi:hypothetical protein
MIGCDDANKLLILARIAQLLVFIDVLFVSLYTHKHKRARTHTHTHIPPTYAT